MLGSGNKAYALCAQMSVVCGYERQRAQQANWPRKIDVARVFNEREYCPRCADHANGAISLRRGFGRPMIEKALEERIVLGPPGSRTWKQERRVGHALTAAPQPWSSQDTTLC